MASIKLGEGYVELFVDDRRYHPAMARAEKALDALAARWRGAFRGGTSGFAAAIGRLNDFRDAADRAERAIRGVIRAINAANTAMAGGSGAGIASVLRAMGAARGAVVRGYGTAIASVIRGAGTAASSVIGSLGRATASNIRAVGSAVGSAMRAAASILRVAVSPLNAAIRGVSSIGRGAVAGARRLLNPMAMLGGLGAGLSAGMFARTARDESIEIEARLVNLGRIADISGDQLGRLGGQLKELARTMPGVKLSDVFDISTIAAKMGVGVEMLPHFTRDLAKMSTVLEDMPIEVATERIGRLITVFEKGPQDAIRFASALNALDIASTASADDILNITTRFAGMAKAFNASPAQAMAWATAIRQAGVPLETSGTATQQIISRLASRQDMGRFARIAGMSKDTFDLKLNKDPLGAMKAVLKGLAEIRKAGGERGASKLSQTLDRLHLDGQRVRGAFLQMIPVVDELDKYLQIAEGDWESLDSVERGYEAKSKTTRAQLELLANNFKLFAASIGDRLMPVVRKLADGLTYLFQDIEKYFNGEGGAVVETWANRVGNALHKVAVVWREWPTFLDLAGSTIREKVEQIQEIFKRLPTVLLNTFTLWQNYFVMMSTFVADLALQVGRSVGQAFFKGLLKSVASMSPELASVLGKINPMFAYLRTLANQQADGVQIDPVVPNLGLLNKQTLFAGLPQGLTTGLPDGLFGNLPNRDNEQAFHVNRISEAERRLTDERNKAAEAAEREAAALRKKVELTGPPKPPPEFFLRKLTPQRSRVLAQRAMRAQFNAQFRRTQQAGHPRRLNRNPVGRLPAIVNRNLQQAGVLPDPLGNLNRAARADRLRRNSAAVEANRQAIDDAGQMKKFADPALLGKNDKTLEGLKKGIDALSKAFADLQRNGVPLALS